MTAYKTAGAAMEVVRELQSRFTQRDALYQQSNEIVFQEREIKVPEVYQKYAMKVNSPLAFYVTHVLASTLGADPINIQLSPFQLGTTGDKNATRRERWHTGAGEQMERDGQRSIYFPFLFADVQKGEGWIKTMARNQRQWKPLYKHSADLLKELKADKSLTNKERNRRWSSRVEEYKKTQGAFPIVTTDVPPESVWYIMGEDGLSCVVESLEIPYSRAFALFKNGESVDGKRISPEAMGLGSPPGQSRDFASRVLKMRAIWDCEDLTYVVDNADQTESFLAKSSPHQYGDRERGVLKGPFFRAEGIPTGNRALHNSSWGLLRAFESVFPMLSATVTGLGQLGFYTSWPWLEQDASVIGREGGISPEDSWGDDPTGLAKRTSQEVKIAPGQVLPPGIHFAQPPRNGQDLRILYDILMSFMEYVLPPVLRGSGGASGYDTNQRVHLGMLNLSMFVQNIQRTLSRREAWIDELITIIGEKVYVEHATKTVGQSRARAEYLGLGPEDVASGRHYIVVMKPSTPSDKSLLVKQKIDEVNNGFQSRASAMEELGYNVDEELLQIQVEQILASQPVQDEINRQIFQRLGIVQAETLNRTNQDFARLLAQGYGQPPGGAMLPQQGGVYAPGEGMPLLPPGPGAGNAPMPGGGGLPGNPGGGPAGVMRPPPGSYPLPGGM